MGQKSGAAWLWVLAGAGALYAALSHNEPPPQAPVPPPLVQAVASAAPAIAPAAPSAADALFFAKRLLLLTHTGQFRSRDLHGRALSALEFIGPSAPEYAEATQLRRGIQSAYAANGGTAPNPDGSPIPPEILQAVREPIAAPNPTSAPSVARIAENGGQPRYAANDAPSDNIAPTPAPVLVPVTAPFCAENGSCYGDISTNTGLPKTVAVHGYTRSNGTYVRGYYRSK
jgi:hypothetical protein